MDVRGGGSPPIHGGDLFVFFSSKNTIHNFVSVITSLISKCKQDLNNQQKASLLDGFVRKMENFGEERISQLPGLIKLAKMKLEDNQFQATSLDESMKDPANIKEEIPRDMMDFFRNAEHGTKFVLASIESHFQKKYKQKNKKLPSERKVIEFRSFVKENIRKMGWHPRHMCESEINGWEYTKTSSSSI